MNRPRLYIFIVLSFLFLSVMPVASQSIVTAVSYFDKISASYGKVSDYEAQLTITQGTGEHPDVSTGTLFYKTPNLLRIDFSDPKNQVICVTGDQLMIYIPSQVVVMTQKLTRHSSSTLATMASSQGLNLLKKGYSISYLDSPDAVPLDEGSDEMVVKLKLAWRTTEQGFRQIIMSVGENNLIRRLKAVTPEMEVIQFDFEGIKTNQNIPDARFDYEAPASAYGINNFLFEPEG
ncbi:MAG: outer-membrane lipoprotein carrier protein LolA [Spirochaetales bacterium]|nr:outer-membrane lipoprotein carrier protein LolA [Spirochaetales bacterium]